MGVKIEMLETERERQRKAEERSSSATSGDDPSPASIAPPSDLTGDGRRLVRDEEGNVLYAVSDGDGGEGGGGGNNNAPPASSSSVDSGKGAVGRGTNSVAIRGGRGEKGGKPSVEDLVQASREENDAIENDLLNMTRQLKESTMALNLSLKKDNKQLLSTRDAGTYALTVVHLDQDPLCFFTLLPSYLVASIIIV